MSTATVPRGEVPTAPSERARPDEEGVSVVIPAYNEEGGAAPVLEELLRVLEEKVAPAMPYEVIVVDDGSSDGTAAAVEPFVGERLRLVRHEVNSGYGAAIKTGVHHARYPWILITDADGTYPAEHIPDLLAHREGHAMVVGARTGEEAHVPLLRRPPKWVLRKLASYLSRREIPDLNSGLRVFRRDMARRFENILPDQFSYTTTITLVTFAAGLLVRYLPINYRRREGKSKIRPIADTLGFLKLIVRTILYFDPLRVFLPLAAFFVVAAVAVAVLSYTLTGRVMDVTTVLLFVTGIHLLALGMIADMLNRRLP
ncbi:MAG: glycosyltransferase family 2 protein [Myxococcota bacterium]